MGWKWDEDGVWRSEEEIAKRTLGCTGTVVVVIVGSIICTLLAINCGVIGIICAVIIGIFLLVCFWKAIIIMAIVIAILLASSYFIPMITPIPII